MDLDEIMRIQKNVQFFLYPKKDIKEIIPNPNAIPLLAEFLCMAVPKRTFVDLEFEIMDDEMWRLIREDIRKQKVKGTPSKSQAKGYLVKSDYGTEVHLGVLKHIENLARLLIEPIISTPRLSWKKLLREAGEDVGPAYKERLEELRNTFSRLGMKLTRKTIEEDVKRTLGRIYETLNVACSEQIEEIKRKSLGWLIQNLQHTDFSDKDRMRYGWACLVSDRPEQNYAVQYLRSPGNELSHIKQGLHLSITEGEITDENFFSFQLLSLMAPYPGSDMTGIMTGFVSDLIGSHEKTESAETERKKALEYAEGITAKVERKEREWQKEKEDRDRRYNALKGNYETAQTRIRELEARPATSPEDKEELQSLRTECTGLRDQISDLETELKDEKEFSAVCADEAATYEEKLILERRRVAELESRLPQDQITVVQRPIYLVQDPDDPQLQAKIENRLGLNYYIVCAILGPGFNMFRNPRLSQASLKKNATGKLKEINTYLGNGNEFKLRDKEYRKHVDELIKGGAIVDHRGLTLMKPADIRDPLLRKVVDLLYEAKREAEN